jgi:hypothetical protein
MKKVIFFLSVLFLVTACGATMKQSRTATFDFNNKEYTTYIKANDGPFGCIIDLYVNDQKIATGTITMAAAQTVISGQYNGVKFDAECAAKKSGGLNMAQQCIIYAKGKKIAEVQY